MALATCPASMLDSMVDDKWRALRVELRRSDGYVNATLMCQSAGKLWRNYNQNKESKGFFAALQSSISSAAGDLVQHEKGSNSERRTWVHQQIAIDLARWISPMFGAWMTGLVLRYAKGEVTSEESAAAAAELAQASLPSEAVTRKRALEDDDEMHDSKKQRIIREDMALATCPASMLDSMVDDQGRALRVELRRSDGYVNATLMCQSAGKLWGNYNQTKGSKAFLRRSARKLSMDVRDLVKYGFTMEASSSDDNWCEDVDLQPRGATIRSALANYCWSMGYR